MNWTILKYFKPEVTDEEKLAGGSFKMGGQPGGLGMFGPMGSMGRGVGNSSMLHKAGNSQNPMLLKVSDCYVLEETLVKPP